MVEDNPDFEVEISEDSIDMSFGKWVKVKLTNKKVIKYVTIGAAVIALILTVIVG